jgi:hypothetical protein
MSSLSSKQKLKLKSKYLIVCDEDGNNNVNIVHNNKLLTANSIEFQESNDLFHKQRKSHRSSDDNIITDIKSNSTRKMDNSDNNNNNNNNNSLIVGSQDFTYL